MFFNLKYFPPKYLKFAHHSVMCENWYLLASTAIEITFYSFVFIYDLLNYWNKIKNWVKKLLTKPLQRRQSSDSNHRPFDWWPWTLDWRRNKGSKFSGQIIELVINENEPLWAIPWISPLKWLWSTTKSSIPGNNISITETKLCISISFLLPASTFSQVFRVYFTCVFSSRK